MSQYKMFKALSEFLETISEIKDNNLYEFKIDFIRKPDQNFHFRSDPLNCIKEIKSKCQ